VARGLGLKGLRKNKMTKKELADLLENFATDILNGVVENTDEMQVLTEKLASIIIEGFSNK
jgi:hypothetical protein